MDATKAYEVSLAVTVLKDYIQVDGRLRSETGTAVLTMCSSVGYIRDMGHLTITELLEDLRPLWSVLDKVDETRLLMAMDFDQLTPNLAPRVDQSGQ